MLEELKLSTEQRQLVVLQEIEYQLTTMKQYLDEDETRSYLLLLNKYGSLYDRQYIMKRYKAAWGDTLDEDAML